MTLTIAFSAQHLIATAKSKGIHLTATCIFSNYLRSCITLLRSRVSSQCVIKVPEGYFSPSLSRNCCSSTAPAMKRLNDKVAIVTASTDGIGFAIAKRLAQEGAKVVISSRKERNVQKAVEELKKDKLEVFGLKCHVGNAADRKRLFEETIKKYGKLNILISNAATNPAVGPVLDCEEGVWDKIFDVNVKSSFMLAKEALPYLRNQGAGGSIIFVSSIAGLNPSPLLGAYSVSKTALFGLTKAAAKDLAREGIRVNCLAPGIIQTKFSSTLHESKEANEAALSTIPMNRLGNSEEMAGVVAFLVSNDASYITGETIVAAGGATSRL